MTTAEENDGVKTETDRRYRRLCKLPNLEEVPHANPMEQLFAQAVLLQLKSLNKDVGISPLAFDDLCYVSLLQLDDLLQSLKKITQVQRRTKISKHDLNLYFEGTGMDLADLNEQVEISNHIHREFKDETKALNENVIEVKGQFMKELDETELLSSKHSEFFVQDVDILNLLPSSNKSNKYVPSWLPELPPDHTYKFTALYKRPVTDERLMKQKLLEEGRLSEKALLHMLSQASDQDPIKTLTKDGEQADTNGSTALSEQIKESQLETELIYAAHKTVKTTDANTVLHGAESFKPSPVKNFDVLEYCKKRDAIVKRKLERAESRAANKRRNPFIRAAMICSPYGQGSTKSRKTVENQLKAMLRRSFLGLTDSIPKVIQEREVARKEAEEKDRIIQEQRRIEKEKKMAEQEVLDLNNLQNDPLLHGWDNDSEEDEELDEDLRPKVQETTDISDTPGSIVPSEPVNGPGEETAIAPEPVDEPTPLPSESEHVPTPVLTPEENSETVRGPVLELVSETVPAEGSMPPTSPELGSEQIQPEQSPDEDSDTNGLFSDSVV